MARKSQITLLIYWLFFSVNSAAVNIELKDSDGQPFAGAVVEIFHPDFKLPVAPTGDQQPAEMQQINRQFKPLILIVPQNSQVLFPNSDSVKHHVYSFSKAKRFQLRLYKDQIPDPITFDKEGVVAIGCNIHDWMSGYIYVAKSRYVKQTNTNGVATFDLPEGDYTYRIWHPRFHQKDSDQVSQLSVSSGNAASPVIFQLSKSLYPEITQDADEFSDYD